MDNTFYVFNDAIAVVWNGMKPIEAPASVTKPEDVLQYFRFIAPVARYNQKLNAFLMSLSAQNLIRIKKQFRDIKCTRGEHLIADLRKKWVSFEGMKKTAAAIKATPTGELPAIDYKVPPLAPYQHQGTVFLTQVSRAPMFADCGCLSGDSIISFNRAGCMRKRPIAELCRNQEENRGNRRADVKTQVRSYKGDGIGLHPIQKIVRRGIKKVLLLTLEDGKSLKATPDHEIMTDRGWVAMEKLVAGDLVMVDNLARHKAKDERVKPKRCPDKRIAVGRHHPYARYQPSHQGRSGSYLLEIHRAIMEAHLSGLEVKAFVKKTYESAEGLVFINPKTHHIHHKDEDHYNNEISNLEVIDGVAHAKLHTRGYKNFEHGEPEFSAVVSVSDAGKESTYDIVCEDPHRNFVANGIVVHNCGKTYMALASTEQQIKTGVIGRGKTLICGKLATLHSGWLEDAKKFTDLKVTCLWLPSNHKKKEKILKLLEDDADVYLINHDGVKVYEDALVEKRFEKVIVDESTVLKSFRGLREGMKGGSFGRALCAVAAHADWRVIMTGTPAPNGPQDLWGQLKFLDPNGFLLERTYSDFKHSYMKEVVFGSESDPNAPRTWLIKQDSIPVISGIVNPLAFRVRIRDHILDLPPKTILKRKVAMNADQERHYEELAEEYMTIVDNEQVTVTIALSLFAKFRQVTGGFLYDLEERPHALGERNPKLEVLDSLLDDEIEISDKVVIFAQFTYEIEMLLAQYKKYNPVSVYGENASKTNIANISKFINDPSVRLIILHPKSAAHGITLTVARYMVFYSTSFSAEDDYQAVARIERASQRNAMFVYYLLCQETVDEYMFQTIQRKHKTQKDLIDDPLEDTAILSMAEEFAEKLRETYPKLRKINRTIQKRTDNGQEREDSAL